MIVLIVELLTSVLLSFLGYRPVKLLVENLTKMGYMKESEPKSPSMSISRSRVIYGQVGNIESHSRYEN